MAAPRNIDIVKFIPTTNGAPGNGDVWRDIADGKLKVHDGGTTSDLVTTAVDSGGTTYKLAEDFTNTDATSTPENVTGMSFTVEASRSYYVEGCLLYFDNDNYGSAAAKFTVPSGATYRLYCVSVDDSANTSDFGTWLNSANRAPLYAGNNWLHFKGMLVTSSTAGTVQLQLVNTAGDGTEQGFRKGSFIKVVS